MSEVKFKVLSMVLFVWAAIFNITAQDSLDILPQSLHEFLRNASVGSVYDDQTLVSLNGGLWATSFFPPDSSAPEVVDYLVEDWPGEYINQRTGEPATPEEVEKLFIYQDWLHQYAPERLRDNDPSTAWVENASDFGRGEMILLDLDLRDQPVEIWSGFGRSQRLFNMNNRPKDIRIYIIEVGNPYSDMFGHYYHYFPLEIKAISEYTLQDINGFQPLPLPDFVIPPNEGNNSQTSIRGHNILMAIEILSVYPGTDWNDTCISEIRNTPSFE